MQSKMPRGHPLGTITRNLYNQDNSNDIRITSFRYLENPELSDENYVAFNVVVEVFAAPIYCNPL